MSSEWICFTRIRPPFSLPGCNFLIDVSTVRQGTVTKVTVSLDSPCPTLQSSRAKYRIFSKLRRWEVKNLPFERVRGERVCESEREQRSRQLRCHSPLFLLVRPPVPPLHKQSYRENDALHSHLKSGGGFPLEWSLSWIIQCRCSDPYWLMEPI